MAFTTDTLAPGGPSAAARKPKPKLAAAAVGDPFAQMSPADIQKTIDQFTAGYGTPLTPEQIQAQAQAQIDPIIAAVTSKANQQASGASDAIKGLTDSYAAELGQLAPSLSAPYEQSAQQQAAIDEALRQSLTGAGSDLASGLSDRLKALEGSSGGSALAEAASGLASQGASSGNQQLASGSAALSNLLGDKAAAAEYGASLPAIARLAGVQQLGQVEGNAQQQIAQGTLAAEQQLPSIVNALTGRNDTLAANRASMGADLFKTLTAQNLSKESAAASAALAGQKAQQDALYKSETLALDAQKAKQTAANDAQRASIAAMNANTSAERAAADRAYKAAMVKLRAADAKIKAASADKPTAGELGTARREAAAALQSYYHGTPAKYQLGPDGSRVLVGGTGPDSVKSYQDAISALALAYPQLGQNTIVGMANRLYKPGEGGRPALSKKQQAATSAALPNPFAGLGIGG